MIDTLFNENTYKKALRAVVKNRRLESRPITLKRLAEAIDVQHTYLSRVFNNEELHLNEDQLFAACDQLHLTLDETEFILLLRSFEVTRNKKRRELLKNKIENIRQSLKLKVEERAFESGVVKSEVEYLFDPLCPLVHVSLQIEKYRKNPRELCQPLGIQPQRLKNILDKLLQIQFIEGNPAKFVVNRVHQNRIHFSTDHPMMRAHQSVLKAFCTANALRDPDQIIHQFMASFSADEEAIHKIKVEFLSFLQKAQTLSMQSKSQNTYQMNFEIFRFL